MSDFKGAPVIIDAFPKPRLCSPIRSYDADWLRQALINREIALYIPSKSNRNIQIDYNKALYPQRHKLEKHVRQTQGPAARLHLL